MVAIRWPLDLPYYYCPASVPYMTERTNRSRLFLKLPFSLDDSVAAEAGRSVSVSVRSQIGITEGTCTFHIQPSTYAYGLSTTSSTTKRCYCACGLLSWGFILPPEHLDYRHRKPCQQFPALHLQHAWAYPILPSGPEVTLQDLHRQSSYNTQLFQRVRLDH